ncbi:MAG: hypothetical protein Q9166_000911 [cf. Caloplaca sp. 2 TL-2023]
MSILRWHSSAWNEGRGSILKYEGGSLQPTRVAYWIHKEKRMFFTVGAEPEPEPDPKDADLAEDGAIISRTQKSLTIATSDSILGKEGAVREYLDKSTDVYLLVKSRNVERNTILSMVAADEHHFMLTIFLDNGANVNNQNDKGRTPLMKAALCGRLETVQILLSWGADRNKNDRNGLKALDFATQSQRDAEERHTRAGGVYKEDAVEADKQRKAIARMLDDKPTPSATMRMLLTPAATSHENHRFYNSGTTSEKAINISGKNWTGEVFAVCKAVGHSLQTDPAMDRGKAGQFNTCHAEKQLAACFVAHHVFLASELVDVEHIEREMCYCPLEASSLMLDGKMMEEEFQRGWAQMEIKMQTRLQKLYHARPPASTLEVTILVSSRICWDCETFIRKVNEMLGLTFRMEAMS